MAINTKYKNYHYFICFQHSAFLQQLHVGNGVIHIYFHDAKVHSLQEIDLLYGMMTFNAMMISKIVRFKF